ncbi:MAG: phosphatase PAP2 family protein [Bacteroidetes bacterium]|nr:phosphatase PAP2 family protein [Bacteroidota bacterium]
MDTGMSSVALGLALLAILSFGLLGWLALERRGAWGQRLHGLEDALAARYPRAWQKLAARASWARPTGAALTLVAVVGLVGVWTFAEVAENWQRTSELLTLDRQVNAAVQRLPEPAVAFLRLVTHLGDPAVLAVLTLALAAVLAWRRKGPDVAALALAMGGGAFWLLALKTSFARPRPVNPYDAPGYSFPSGHATGSMLLYGFAAWLVLTRLPERWRALGVLLALVPLVVGISRIGLSVHWVSDVLGGWVLGLSWLTVSLVVGRALRERRS